MFKKIKPYLFALLVLTSLNACIHLEVLDVRNKSEELYKEGRTTEIIPLVETTMAKVKEELGADHYYIGEAYHYLAILYAYTINNFELADTYFKRALEIRTKNNGLEHRDTIETINMMGFLYQVTGKLELAESQFKKALALRIKVLGADHPDTADSETYLAGLYLRLGRYGKAEKLALHASKYEQEEVSIRHPTPGEAFALLGSIYSAMGDNKESEEYYKKSLALKRKELGADHSEVSHSLSALGHIYMNRGDQDKAIKYFNNALRIREKAFGHIHGFTGDTIIALGNSYLMKGDKILASKYLTEGLDVYKKSMGEDNYRVLYAKKNLAYLYLFQQDFEKAKQLCESILISPQTQALKSLSWSTKILYSIIQNKLGNTDIAIFFGKNAVNELQTMRSDITTLDNKLQKGFVRERAYAYRTLATTLIETGRLAEAQQVLTMLKEDEHFSYVRRSKQFDDVKKTRVNYNATEEPWQQRYQEINTQIAQTGKNLERLRNKKRTGLTPEEQTQLKLARKDLKVVKKVFNQFLDELTAEIKKNSPTRAAEIGKKNLSSLKAMQGTLRELGKGVVLVHYLITDETLYIILTTPNVQIVRRKNIKSSQLNKEINTLRRALQSPDSEPKKPAYLMYQTLFAPIAKDLSQAGAKTIMTSLDGALRYIPLSTLYDGEKYLAEKYSFTVFTAAAQTKLTSKPNANWRVAGLGVVKEIGGFISLPSVKSELNNLIKTDDNDKKGVLPGTIHLDESFTKEALIDALDSNFPILHIASHFVFNTGAEKNSFLLLGDGTQLSLAEISEEDFDFNSIDMLTLSACETAVGSVGANGNEIEGFGWLAQRQGAKSVLATLWPVADISTGIFMQNMYEIKQKKKLSKAVAVQQAQLIFLHSPQFSHPFFWGPFILMGNWL
ncbi:MAG: CHAT domain-containing protein [Methylococcaceae bacterium]|nr:CHAT domain-containing protein [Methylococcaceae bacterium]